MTADYWNHNVHYHPLVLEAVPEGCGAALDVGCGDGLLAQKLADRARTVVGVDRSSEMIRLARERSRSLSAVAFAQADFLEESDQGPLAAGQYDFVSAVAVVHHAEFDQAVRALVRLLAPGGRLVVIGLACNRTPLDWVISGAGVPVSRWKARRHGGKAGPVGMPILDTSMAWSEVRSEAKRLLPGVRFRRHLLWRYSVLWDKPLDASDASPAQVPEPRL
jgi:SAM-dependent methyltransferase